LSTKEKGKKEGRKKEVEEKGGAEAGRGGYSPGFLPLLLFHHSNNHVIGMLPSMSAIFPVFGLNDRGSEDGRRRKRTKRMEAERRTEDEEMMIQLDARRSMDSMI